MAFGDPSPVTVAGAAQASHLLPFSAAVTILACVRLSRIETRWAPVAKAGGGLLVLAALIQGSHTWLNPPDPNRGLVEAVLAAPAPAPGATLVIADPRRAPSIEFYSNWKPLSLPLTQSPPPGAALLVRYQGHWVIRPAQP